MWMLEVWLVVSKIICVTKLHFTFSRWQCPMDCSCICRKCMIIYKECVDLKSHIFLLSLSKSPHIMMQLFLSKACIKWSQWMPDMLYLDVLHVYNVTSELLFGINFVTPSVFCSKYTWTTSRARLLLKIQTKYINNTRRVENTSKIHQKHASCWKYKQNTSKPHIIFAIQAKDIKSTCCVHNTDEIHQKQ